MIDYKVKTVYVSTLGLDPFQCVEDVVSKWVKYYYNTFEADGKFYQLSIQEHILFFLYEKYTGYIREKYIKFISAHLIVTKMLFEVYVNASI